MVYSCDSFHMYVVCMLVRVYLVCIGQLQADVCLNSKYPNSIKTYGYIASSYGYIVAPGFQHLVEHLYASCW